MLSGRKPGDARGLAHLSEAKRVNLARGLLRAIRGAEFVLTEWRRDRAAALAALERMASRYPPDFRTECIEPFIRYTERTEALGRQPTRRRSAESHWLSFADFMLGITDKDKAGILYSKEDEASRLKVRRLRSGRKQRRQDVPD